MRKPRGKIRKTTGLVKGRLRNKRRLGGKEKNCRE